MNWKVLWRKKDVLTPTEAASRRKGYIFAVCLLCSALFWLFTKLSQETVVGVEKPVRFTSIPANQIGVAQSDSSILVSLEGTGLSLIRSRIALHRQILVVDGHMANTIRHHEGESIFVTAEMLAGLLERGIDGRVKIRNIRPDSLFLEVTPAVTKKLPVSLQSELSFERRFKQYGELAIEPDSIEIWGPSSMLDTIQQLHTVKWVATDLRTTTEILLDIQFPGDGKQIHAENYQVRVRVPVEEYTEASKSLPIQLHCPDGNATPDIRLFPSSTRVHYLVALRDFQQVSKDMFSVRADCPDLSENSDDRLRLSLENYPPFVEVLYLRPAEVEYIILE